MDLYQLLGVSRDATPMDIKKGYKAMVLKWHPDKNPDDREKACKMFRKVSEAYQVLSDPQRRMMYDQFGMDSVGGASAFGASMSMGCDADRLFREMFGHLDSMFGGPDPFMSCFDGPMGSVKFSFGCDPCPSQPETMVRPLRCSLEELYLGCTKRFRITRTLECGAKAEECLAIEVKPGWKAGTKVTFPGKGEPTTLFGPPSDLCFVLEEKEHERFRREGNDLHVSCPVSLIDALTGFTAEVRTLDNRVLSLPVAHVVKPGASVRVPGEGWPITRSCSPSGQMDRGDLHVHFAIAFPEALSNEQRAFLRQAFGHPPLPPHLLHPPSQGPPQPYTFHPAAQPQLQQQKAAGFPGAFGAPPSFAFDQPAPIHTPASLDYSMG